MIAHSCSRLAVLGPLDELPTESALGAWAKTGIVRIGDPLSKPRM
jgi:hypothetical protein